MQRSVGNVFLLLLLPFRTAKSITRNSLKWFSMKLTPTLRSKINNTPQGNVTVRELGWSTIRKTSEVTNEQIRERSLLYICKGKYHVPSTSQKAGLTGLYKNFLLMSTTAISKPVFQEVDGTVILPLTNIKEWAFPAWVNSLSVI